VGWFVGWVCGKGVSGVEDVVVEGCGESPTDVMVWYGLRFCASMLVLSDTLV